MKPPANPKAVIFDLGNTLLFWNTGPMELSATASQLGTSLGLQEATILWSDLNKRSLTSGELVMGKGWSESAYRHALADYYQAADATVPGMTDWLVGRAVDPGAYRAFPGAHALVTDLRRAGVRLGVISDTGFDIRPALVANDLVFPDHTILLSHEQGMTKPDARLFARACDLLEVNPHETLMVGDNSYADGGSVAAGVAAFLLPTLSQHRERDYDLIRAATGLHGHRAPSTGQPGLARPAKEG